MNEKRVTVDERQRMELLEVEHMGFWVLFYGLILAILAQLIFMQPDWKLIAGELVGVLLGGGVVVVGCVRRGLWDYCTVPTKRTYVTYAGATAGFIVLLVCIVRLIKGQPINILHTVALAAGTFAAAFAMLALMGRAVLKRRIKLENKTEDR